MNRAFEAHDAGIAPARVSAQFDTLHGDPRWSAFPEGIGLSPSALPADQGSGSRVGAALGSYCFQSLE
jgi:hypothetical protein